MPWNLGPSVAVRNGCDYWRTWFLEECEESQRFGLTEKHLGLITKFGEDIVPYKVGTLVYFEDAPYFKAEKKHHRIVGPYEVFAPENLPPGVFRVFPKEGPLLVWKEPHPEAGPWLDRASVSRTIDGTKVRFSQTASRFGHFPYRFAIRQTKGWKVEYVAHEERGCWLCR